MTALVVLAPFVKTKSMRLSWSFLRLCVVQLFRAQSRFLPQTASVQPRPRHRSEWSALLTPLYQHVQGAERLGLVRSAWFQSPAIMLMPPPVRVTARLTILLFCHVQSIASPLSLTGRWTEATLILAPLGLTSKRCTNAR